MEILHIVLTSTGSIAVLFILTKILGYRQMSQLSMFDYVNGITIGSIAAEMATSLETDFSKPLTAMIIYALFALLFSKISDKSVFARRFIVGKPSLIYNNGELYFKNLQKANMDLSEFMTQCRISGYFDLSEIQTAVLEPNGRISFLPKADARPVALKDLKIRPEQIVSAGECAFQPEQDYLVANVIIDGNIMTENLRHTGHDAVWLKNQIRAGGVSDIKDVFLATCDIHNKVHIYKKISEKCRFDILG